ncbi:MAG: MipA/OmpV family protein [Granulosicoccaceae bacterium]
MPHFPTPRSALLTVSLILFSHSALAEEAANTDNANLATEAAERVKQRLNKLGTEAHTEMKPRWEIGLGGLHLGGKDYPASDQDNVRTFVVPYMVYRGEKLRIGEGGVSAMAFENSRFSLDVSVAGSVNANSDNELREGLPEIDYMFELGPQLVVTLQDRLNADGTRSEMTFSTQMRAAFETDFSDIDSRGGVLTTVLEWERSGFMDGRLGFFAEIGPKWATEDLQDVFYQVDDQYATAEREAFDAKGGYMGTDLQIGLSYQPTPNIWLYGALGQKLYRGAANEDSPLFETDSSNTFWLGGLWRIKSSKELVAVLRD